MEEEPVERVTTHHRSVGKEGCRGRDGGMKGGVREGGGVGGGVRYWSHGLDRCRVRASCPGPSVQKHRTTVHLAEAAVI